MAKGFNSRGMGGMGGNMNSMLRQAQKMQQDMLKAQEELESKSYEASAGGGVVTAVVSGRKELTQVTIDPEAVELAQHNAKQAGVDARIEVVQRDIKDFFIPKEKGVVICNPPYGERLLDIKAAQEIYRTMGKVFGQGFPHRYYIISPDMEFERSFGRKADKRRKLYNGMIPCQLYMYFKG